MIGDSLALEPDCIWDRLCLEMEHNVKFIYDWNYLLFNLVSTVKLALQHIVQPSI